MKYKLKNHILFMVLFMSSIKCLPQHYFQQEVKYKIKVTLNDSIHELYGYEEIEYTNNSPDDLDFIYFHLWANAFKNNNTALAKQKFERSGKLKLFDLESQRGYIDSLNFKVNGKVVQRTLNRFHIDIWDYSNDIHSNYLQKIRFVINLKGFNFFEVFRNQKKL